MVLVGTDGNTVVAKSTGIGGARVPGMPDGIQGTRNTPIIGFTAPTDGQYFLAVYDYHIEGGGPVPVTLEVNSRPAVLCSDRPDSNCVDEYPDQCVDQRNWVILRITETGAHQLTATTLSAMVGASQTVLQVSTTLDTPA